MVELCVSALRLGSTKNLCWPRIHNYCCPSELCLTSRQNILDMDIQSPKYNKIENGLSIPL